MEDFFPSGLKTRVRIANSKFTVPIKGPQADGRIQGEILSDGTFVGSGVINRTLGARWRMTLAFSTPYRDGVYSAQGLLHGGSSNAGGQRYRITLTRATQTQLTPPE